MFRDQKKFYEKNYFGFFMASIFEVPSCSITKLYDIAAPIPILIESNELGANLAQLLGLLIDMA